MKKRNSIIIHLLILSWLGMNQAIGIAGDQSDPYRGDQHNQTFTESVTAPTHFIFTSNTDDSYSIVINNATLDDSVLQVNDEIGVFTPAGLCVGAAVWTGTMPLPLIAWLDDSQTTIVDGYKEGEAMSFRIWDRSANTLEDYPATPTYMMGKGTFGDGAYARLSLLKASTVVSQNIVLDGGWSWISLNTKPDTLDIERVLASLDKLTIATNGAGQFYVPKVINNIGQINPLEGYKIHLASPDTLSVKGLRLSSTTPIPLLKGWNFTTYLPPKAMNVEVALSSVRSNLAIIKNDAGGYYIPGVINSLGDMTPGEGYKLYINAAGTLIYPTDAALAKAQRQMPITVNEPCAHYRYRSQTGAYDCVLVTSVETTDLSMVRGDEIGIFTEKGLCVGGGRVQANGAMAMAAWQDDPSTKELDGYQPGEKMIFKLWRIRDQRERELTVTFARGCDQFEADHYASVSLREIGPPLTYSLNQNYPNPFNPRTTIRYYLPVSGQVRITIYNAVGQEVRRLVDEERPAGSAMLAWDGLDAAGEPVPSGVYMYRLVVGDFSQTKKMLLIK